jgi:hypothetical protein
MTKTSAGGNGKLNLSQAFLVWGYGKFITTEALFYAWYGGICLLAIIKL